MATTVCLSELPRICQSVSLDGGKDQVETRHLTFRYQLISFSLTRIQIHINALLNKMQMPWKMATWKVTLKSKVGGRVGKRPRDQMMKDKCLDEG